MRVSLKWLEEYVDPGVPVDVLVERLDLSGTKVEAVHRPRADVSDVRVAEVLAVQDHPDADSLTIVDVRARDGRHSVVCGARNFSVGDRVPFAAVGARLPGATISARRIRGRQSDGMLCSAAELGVGDDSSGILVLPADAPVGRDVVEVLGLDDTILELEITPNRPDCMSMVGVAREVAALFGRELRKPGAPEVGADAARLSLRVEDERACPRYLALEIDSIEVAPSPAWLARRLLAAGIRPISNVVDATNYVMLETGQPLHAFEAAALANRTIVVRRARAAETLVTLDGVERRLHPEDLVIADAERAVGLAGVMGGAGSEISGTTTGVVLEAAYFDPASVAFIARRHLLRTEASARFERGADPNAVPWAARRAARLIEDLAGARTTAVIDLYPSPIRPRTLELRTARTKAVLGIEIDAAEQASILSSIELPANVDDGRLTVSVPTFRPDVTREIDLVEEVARLAGYGRLDSTVPFGSKGGLTAEQAAERGLRFALVGLGLSEAWTTSFGAPEDLDALGLAADHRARSLVLLENPTSQQFRAMRTTVLPGLLRAAAHNLRQRLAGVALFEAARVYLAGSGQLPDEVPVLAAVFSGERAPQRWHAPAKRWDFFAAKGVVEAACGRLGVPAPVFRRTEAMPWHPTRAASLAIAERAVGALGEVHPDVCERFEVPPGTVAFELDLDGILALERQRPRAAEPPRFPGVYVDLALVVDDAVPSQAVRDLVARAGAPEVVSVRLFDVYRGEQVDAGRKSLAFALEMRAPDRTLTDDEAHAVRDRIVREAASELGAELRS